MRVLTPGRSKHRGRGSAESYSDIWGENAGSSTSTRPPRWKPVLLIHFRPSRGDTDDAVTSGSDSTGYATGRTIAEATVAPFGLHGHGRPDLGPPVTDHVQADTARLRITGVREAGPRTSRSPTWCTRVGAGRCTGPLQGQNAASMVRQDRPSGIPASKSSTPPDSEHGVLLSAPCSHPLCTKGACLPVEGRCCSLP